MVDKPFEITPREAVLWGKANLKPKSRPGEKHLYGDTNYYLLGLIIEHITGKPFHEALHEFIFRPLEMSRAFMNGYSKPAEKSEYPTAKLFTGSTMPAAGLSRLLRII